MPRETTVNTKYIYHGGPGRLMKNLKQKRPAKAAGE
jgi:hypothetical protein